MPKTPINAPVERSVLNKEGFLTIRKKLSSEVQTVFTAHDTYIGVIGNEADLTVNGALAVTGGASGVYKFPDGTCSIREGENTSVVLNADGSVTIDTVEGRDISELLDIANSVEARMDSVESQFENISQGFQEYTGIVESVQSQFTDVLNDFNQLNVNVATYDTRITSAEASVANVLAAEAAQNTQISNLQSALTTEINSRITQGVNFLSDITRLDGKISAETTARNQLSSSLSTTITGINTSTAQLSSSLASRVTRLEIASSSFSSSITSLRLDLTTESLLRSQLATEFTSSFQVLDAKIDQEIVNRELSITSLTEALTISGTLLNTRITNLSGSVATDINGLRSKVTALSGSVATDVNGLRSTVTNLSSSVATDIRDLRSTVTNLSSSVAFDIGSLATELQNLSYSTSTNFGNLTNSISTLSSSVASDINYLRLDWSNLSGSVASDIGALGLSISTKVDTTTFTNLSSSLNFSIGELLATDLLLQSAVETLNTTVASLAAGSGSSNATSTTGNFAFNETPTGTIDGTNTQFTLANTPSPASSLMLFYNGQLMSVGAEADYVLNGNIITFVGKISPTQDDVLLATYFYRSPTKSYKFNEAVTFTTTGSTSHAVLDFVPDPPNSLMLFMNGQLLTQGGDYTLSGKDVTSELSQDIDDVYLATYSYS